MMARNVRYFSAPEMLREAWAVIGPLERGKVRQHEPSEIAAMSLAEWRKLAVWYDYRDDEVDFVHRLARWLDANEES